MRGDLASLCYKEVAESGWGPGSIIIKAEAYITPCAGHGMSTSHGLFI